MKQFTPDDEIFILEQGIKSDFWILLTQKWSGFRQIALNSLLAPDYAKRDFLAGKVKGMDDILGYPEKHIKTLKEKLVKQSNQ